MRTFRRRERRTFAERNPIPLGIIGTLVVVVLLAMALNVSKLPFVNTGHTYRAAFTELGGLASGDDVLVSGLPVGKVSSVGLAGTHVQITFKVTDGNVDLGGETTASIVTETVLGKKALQLVSAGGGTLRIGSTIPTSRTVAPYDITQALAGLTQKVQSLDTANLVRSLNTISSTFSETPASVKTAISALSKIAETINTRDSALQSLLVSADNVTSVVAQRDSKITLLLADGTKLLSELNARRQVITGLLQTVTAVAQQLIGLVRDNTVALKPALTQLNQVLTLLNDNQKNLVTAINELGPFATSLGEVVGSGPFFDAYVQNLTAPTSLAPVLSGLAGK